MRSKPISVCQVVELKIQLADIEKYIEVRIGEPNSMYRQEKKENTT